MFVKNFKTIKKLERRNNSNRPYEFNWLITKINQLQNVKLIT